MSATLHAVIAAVILFFTWMGTRPAAPVTPVFELVAGEGDNYMAKAAPALGTPGGLKVDVPAPKPPTPEPEPARAEPPPPEPVNLTPAPPAPAPAPVAPAPTPAEKAPQKTTPSLTKQIQRKLIVAESQAKRDIARERAAEAKRLAEEKKKQEQLSKAEFDARNKTKTVASNTKTPPAKIPKVDAEGISKGVTGGSRDNKTGGAGGKAMTTDNDDVLGAYFALFKQRLRTRFEPPPGLSDSLTGQFEFRSHADGSISNPSVVRSSGSAEFDRAVLDAIRRVTLPERPDKKTEMTRFTFSMREQDSG